MNGTPLNAIGAYTPATVLCCECSRPIDGTSGLVMCPECIQLKFHVAEGIPREAHVQFCRNCERFLVPPSSWIAAQPESRELLAILLKRLPIKKNIRLVDAAFLWTEPHSRRILVKVAVQGEVHGVVLQETFEVEFVVLATQCPDCARSFTVHQWRACVQLRQKVAHKRTFFWLEQLMLKHNAHADTVAIKENRDGIDFFFMHPQHALRLLDFLSTVAPIRSKKSEELVSKDSQTGSKSFKFSYSAEIAPICREDLVVLPKGLAHKLGGLPQVVICSRVTNMIQFLDPTTLAYADLPSAAYWREPVRALVSADALTEFIVLDCEPLGPMRGKWVLADASVALASDMTQTFIVRTHLGALLHPGDSALGYYLLNSNFNNSEWDTLLPGAQPDIVLVKKSYPRRRSKRSRNWKLKRLAKIHNETVDASQVDKVEHDYEVFLRELEEDQELRQSVNLYKSSGQDQQTEDAEDDLVIDVTELLDDLEGMSLNEL